MKKFSALIFLSLAIVTQAFADPCDSGTKQHVAITTSGKQVTGLASTNIFLCQIAFTAATGTAATYTIQQGTGTNCGTGTTSLTGAFTGGSPIVIGDGGFNILTATGGNDLCITFGGSGGSAQGILTFVQQPY